MSDKKLNWSDRFALIDRYKPTDENICSALGVSNDELVTARQLRGAGTIQPSTDLKVENYASMFSGMSVAAKASKAPVVSSTPAATSKKSTATSHTKSSSGKKANAPTTATKAVREPKKRGRKGTNIAEAFVAIPSTPVPVEEFASKNNVSLNVLRQSKRFDKSGTGGAVRVKKDKESGTLMIWRDLED